MTQILNSVVTNKEADALKEMIFRRATERASKMDEEIKNNYTTSAHNDIMDLARNSFVAKRNPFSILEPQKKEVKEETKEEIQEAKKQEESIGFPQKRDALIREKIEERNKATHEEISEAQVRDAMIDARVDLSKRTSFMGALNFLNAQASIALINKRGRRFEATV